MKKAGFFDVVDEVLDAGDVLVIRSRHVADQVALSDIIKVEAAVRSYPQVVTLSLKKPSLFGVCIRFIAPSSQITFLGFHTETCPVIDELTQRIEAKRSA
jgi:hypothetical protein